MAGYNLKIPRILCHGGALCPWRRGILEQCGANLALEKPARSYRPGARDPIVGAPVADISAWRTVPPHNRIEKPESGPYLPKHQPFRRFPSIATPWPSREPPRRSLSRARRRSTRRSSPRFAHRPAQVGFAAQWRSGSARVVHLGSAIAAGRAVDQYCACLVLTSACVSLSSSWIRRLGLPLAPAQGPR